MFQFASCCLFSVSTFVALLFLLNLSSRANVAERSWMFTAAVPVNELCPPYSRHLAMEIFFFFLSFFATIWKTTGWDAYHKSMCVRAMFVCGVNRKSEWVRKRVWEELHPLMRRWWCFRLFISFIATVLQAFGVTDWQREVKQSVSDVLADVGVNSEITQPSCHFAWPQWELSNSLFFLFFCPVLVWVIPTVTASQPITIL